MCPGDDLVTEPTRATRKPHPTCDAVTPEPHALAITVAYRGAGFAGFARQPGQRTVQGCLENALGIIVRREIDIAVPARGSPCAGCAGRVRDSRRGSTR